VRTLSITLTIGAVIGCLTIQTCKPSDVQSGEVSGLHFNALKSEETGIAFRNDVPYTDSFNCYLFRNFYNGGGVGIGDVNNDGLMDVFLCGNMTPNRLYLNLGNWKFRDITEESGMGLSKTWTAGVAMADVNGDGLLDIYTCKSGPPGGPDRHNELFINQLAKAGGVPKFAEQSAQYGLDNTGLSTHAAFFDYDRDGDLDCYLLNNSMRSVGGYDFRPGQRDKPDPEGGNQLLRNDGARFTNVSQKAGIYSSSIGFGLGVTIGDYDCDGWQDIFVSNDFFERDYLYHNQQNGTFREVLDVEMPEISKGSMGADMADLNNDGFSELFVTEMTPPDDRRYKTKATFDDWNTYQTMLQTGYHRQFGRNVLQLNNHSAQTNSHTLTSQNLTSQKNLTSSQNLTSHQSHTALTSPFSEIGRQAGVACTDWSWGALMADFDNDGWKDIFVANGIGKDLLDQDYVNFYSNPTAIREVLQKNPGQGIKTLIDQMPSEPLANYFFHQKNAKTGGIPQFSSIATEVGLGTPSFSNGSAYGDLDNDGDLDLVVNNVNMPCFVYRNDTKTSANWLKINLIGEQKNTNAFGAKVIVAAGGTTQYQEVAPMRGFESCVDPRPNFGVNGPIEKVEVRFLSGKSAVLNQVQPNQILTIREADATQVTDVEMPSAIPSQPVLALQSAPLASASSRPARAGRSYSDFDREPLLFRMFSADGYKVAVGDVNKDGLDDIYECGPAEQTGKLYIQTKDGQFKPSQQVDFEQDSPGDDSAAAFFDANGDGHLDLYVGAGSNTSESGSPVMQDRLYLNDGCGRMMRLRDALPQGKPFATSCVRPHDVDSDGDKDIFVGMRLVPGHYGQSPQSFILLNDGTGHFQPAPPTKYPALAQLGMVTDAAWADLDNNGSADLIVAADWQPVRVVYFQGVEMSLRPTDLSTSGWWNCLTINDLDKDSDLDVVAGNFGWNSHFNATKEKPMALWLGDFDNNGRDEPLLTRFNGTQSYPMALRNDVVKQMPMLKKKYLKYANYANQTIEQMFGTDVLGKAQQLQATTLSTSVIWNRGSRNFEVTELSDWAQITPVYAIVATDMTGDGHIDLLLAGNHERCKPEAGVHLASHGIVLAGDGLGHFNVQKTSGLRLDGSVRGLETVRTTRGPRIIATRVEQPAVLVGW
jgi:enediyne biosynthesis protein E4